MKKKKQQDDAPIIYDGLESIYDEEIKCKHCGDHYLLESGFDENYCSRECMLADTEE